MVVPMVLGLLAVFTHLESGTMKARDKGDDFCKVSRLLLSEFSGGHFCSTSAQLPNRSQCNLFNVVVFGGYVFRKDIGQDGRLHMNRSTVLIKGTLISYLISYWDF